MASGELDSVVTVMLSRVLLILTKLGVLFSLLNWDVISVWLGVAVPTELEGVVIAELGGVVIVELWVYCYCRAGCSCCTAELTVVL